jgi:hypothetical protein
METVKREGIDIVFDGCIKSMLTEDVSKSIRKKKQQLFRK